MEWCQRREAGALPAVAGFHATVHELGGRIAIVTNRRANVQADTEANFASLGLPFDVILTRPMDASGKKEPRWEQVRRGTTAAGLPPLTIVMWLGDNIGDFPDLDQELRAAEESGFSGFGRRYFLLPNPVYGSWESNPQK